MSRFVFKLPDVGEGVAEAEITAWHVSVGAEIEEDAPLVDVMTDKATVELTSPVKGTIVSLHGDEGDVAAVGSELVVFETEGEVHHASHAPPPKPEPKPAKTPAPEPEPEPEPAPSAPAAKSKTVLAAPAVRERARRLGVDLASVTGSGPEGRITHADLDALQGGAAAPAGERRDGVTDVKVIGLRRRIAEKMQESKRNIPHFAYVEECDVTELEALRVHLNGEPIERPKLSLLPFLMRALVRVLPDFPQINATFDDEAGVVHRHAAVHIGIATQTANGLLVPVVRHAETLDLWASAREVARLATAAREGKADAKDLTGSTITLTSLGPLGGIAHTPVINRPEVAIVGPNRVALRPVVRDGQVVVRKIMNISSSFDHRVVDGYDAASFIQALKSRLEHPATLFI
jgi:2-oxoisovalerate dehydrogenase E2 component (dihydrolipoyl transacylase)